jgi:hypothetical protein
MNWATDKSAPVLSRSVDVASRRMFENHMLDASGAKDIQSGWHIHGAAQNRREMI